MYVVFANFVLQKWLGRGFARRATSTASSGRRYTQFGWRRATEEFTGDIPLPVLIAIVVRNAHQTCNISFDLPYTFDSLGSVTSGGSAKVIIWRAKCTLEWKN